MKKLFIMSFFLLNLLFFASAGFSQSNYRKIVSYSTVYVCNNNVVKARKMAIRGALVSAIEITLSDFITRDLFASNFDDLSKLFVEKRHLFIDKFQVIQSTHFDHYYKVMLEVEVDEDKIKEELTKKHIVLNKENHLKIATFISEQDLSRHSPYFWWNHNYMQKKDSHIESTLKKAMQKKGFDFIDLMSFVNVIEKKKKKKKKKK